MYNYVTLQIWPHGFNPALS